MVKYRLCIWLATSIRLDDNVVEGVGRGWWHYRRDENPFIIIGGETICVSWLNYTTFKLTIGTYNSTLLPWILQTLTTDTKPCGCRPYFITPSSSLILPDRKFNFDYCFGHYRHITIGYWHVWVFRNITCSSTRSWDIFSLGPALILNVYHNCKFSDRCVSVVVLECINQSGNWNNYDFMYNVSIRNSGTITIQLII